MYSRLIRTVRLSVGLVLLLLLAGCGANVPLAPDTGSPPSAVPKSDKIIIAAVGDIMLDGSAREIMQKHGYDFAFQSTRNWLSTADIAFGNLEGPLTVRGEPAPDKKYLFRSPPEKVVTAMNNAGFDVVSLANNHTLDYGAEGMMDTILALQKSEIGHVGAGENLAAARRATYINRNGYTIAFLAYSLTFPEEFWATRNRAGTAFGHRQHIETDIQTAKDKADIVVVSFHWGRESTTELRPYQVGLGRAAINAGASLVIGHHPHILQAVEQYKDGVILYSMGNFAFGSYSRKARYSAVAEIEFNKSKLTQVRLRPINVFNVDVLFQPTPLTGSEADKVVKELQVLSQPRNTNLINDKGTALLQLQQTIRIVDKK